MREALAVGDRVRVTASCRAADYRPGDKGTVLRAFALATSGSFGYVVAMDRDGRGAGTAFTEGEVERDG